MHCIVAFSGCIHCRRQSESEREKRAEELAYAKVAILYVTTAYLENHLSDSLRRIVGLLFIIV